MKIFKAKQVRDADAFTILNEPISSIDLMERAATKACQKIKQFIQSSDFIAIFVGSGNNGGDGLAIARQLLEANYQVKVYDLALSSNYTEDFLINKARLLKLNSEIIDTEWPQNHDFEKYDIIIDAILGSGLTRPIEGDLAKWITQINASRAKVIAIDIPSGLFAENNDSNNKDAIVKADYTLTFQFPKIAFLLAENEPYVGRFEVIEIGIHSEYIRQTASSFYYTLEEDIDKSFFERSTFSHKGTFGHALLFVGSEGKMGAGILASKSCLRSGAGLVSVLVPKTTESTMQMALPEAMTVAYNDKDKTCNMLDYRIYEAIGLGPGIGQSKQSLNILTALLDKIQKPAVFDADALNLLSQNPELLKKVPENSIFTPHPKELERLIGVTENHYSRLFKTQEYAQKHKIYLLIKGAFSVIVCPDGTFHFNSTGNPGMATAGSGDVLTGIITAFLAQGLDSFEALRIAVFVHGLAGDEAKRKHGEMALIASDIIDNLGAVFKSISKSKATH